MTDQEALSGSHALPDERAAAAAKIEVGGMNIRIPSESDRETESRDSASA